LENFGLNSSGLEQGSLDSSCGYGNEPSDSVKGGKFFDQMSNYQFHKEDSLHGIGYLVSFPCVLLTHKGVMGKVFILSL